jgi:hypothetical protein
MARLHVIVIAMILAGCAGEQESPACRCEKMRDHIVDLQLADTSGIARTKHRDAMRRALGPEFIENCQRSYSAAQVRCVLNATSKASARACKPIVR